MLTVADLKLVVRQALGGAPEAVYTSEALTRIQYINEAGRHLCQMHPWKFLERPTTTLNLTASQSYIALPADLGTVISLTATTFPPNFIEWVDFETLQNLRAGSGGAADGYAAAIVHPTQASVTAAPDVPRVELYPTPSASATAALTLRYRAAWTELANTDANVANIPAYVEGLYTRLLRAWVREIEEERDDLVAAVEQHPVFERAKRFDGMRQPDYGPIRNGAADLSMNLREYGDTAVADPV